MNSNGIYQIYQMECQGREKEQMFSSFRQNWKSIVESIGSIGYQNNELHNAYHYVQPMLIIIFIIIIIIINIINKDLC